MSRSTDLLEVGEDEECDGEKDERHDTAEEVDVSQNNGSKMIILQNKLNAVTSRNGESV